MRKICSENRDHFTDYRHAIAHQWFTAACLLMALSGPGTCPTWVRKVGQSRHHNFMSTRPSGRQWPIAPRSAWQPKSSWRPLPLMKLLSPGPGSSRRARRAAIHTAPKDNIARAAPASGSRRRKSFAAGLRSTVEPGARRRRHDHHCLVDRRADDAGGRGRACALPCCEHRADLRPRRIGRGRCDLSVTQGFPREISGEPPMAHDASRNEDGFLKTTDPAAGGRHEQTYDSADLGTSPRPGVDTRSDARKARHRRSPSKRRTPLASTPMSTSTRL